MEFNMKTFCNNIVFINGIKSLIEQIDNVILEKNNLICKRASNIDFYDIFYYLLYYNSEINNTHSQTIINYNCSFNNNLSENAFINRLCRIDEYHFKEINKKMVTFFYDYFKIKTKNLSTDGSVISLLKCHKESYDCKNDRYCTGYVNSIVDNDYEFPITIDLYESANEITNLKTQLNYLNSNDIIIMDRGYESYDLINYFLKNNNFFIMRLPKSNIYSKSLVDCNEKIINYEYENNQYVLKLIKYNNKTKPIYEETIDDFNNLVDENNIKINKKNINKIKFNKSIRKLKTINKELSEKINKLKQENKNTVNKENLKKYGNERTINKIKIKALNDKVTKSTNLINKLKKENSEHIKKRDEIINYYLSDYYIITNKIIDSSKLKDMYKTRWVSETTYRIEKDILKLRNFENKNIKLVKQNIYIIQFILIINAFIKKLFENMCKKNYHFSTKSIISSLHNYIFKEMFKLLINKKIIKNIENIEIIKKNKDVEDFKIKSLNYKQNIKKQKYKTKQFLLFEILKYCYVTLSIQIKKVKEKKNRERVKKRPSTKWSYLPITQ